jgi:hypothetical protein
VRVLDTQMVGRLGMWLHREWGKPMRNQQAVLKVAGCVPSQQMALQIIETLADQFELDGLINEDVFFSLVEEN